MARRNISLPDDLDEQARKAGMNVSALAQQAVADELDRRSRMNRLDAWLDELDAAHGPPSAETLAEAGAWASSGRAVRRRGSDLELLSSLTENAGRLSVIAV
ncbi:MAG: type II toxin-antitoxin system CcdA family antitoxin [Acidimicrobiales bacterium]